MHMNERGLAMLKESEGCKLTAYRDAVGIWTIGYGHTSAAGEPVVKAGLKISADEAEQILIRDLRKYEDAVVAAVNVPCNGNQFSALVSFCYNVGPGNMKNSSVVKYFNNGKLPQAADAFRYWNKAGGKTLPGLITRRERERALFMLPDAPEQPAQPVLPDPPDVESPEPETASTGFWAWLWSLFGKAA